MKYTVVIEQAVPEEVLGQLQQALSERFNLNADQANKLAARRGGRLMKPTDRERARVLLGLFQGVGAKVRLETIGENGEAQAAIAQPTAVAATVPTTTVPSSLSPAPAPRQDSALLASEFGQPEVQGAESIREGGLAARGSTSAQPSTPSNTPGVGDDFWAELSTPAPLGTANPAPASDAPDLDGTHSLDSLFGAAPTAQVAPQVALASSSAAQGEASGDIWSDFTGALTITDTLSVPAAAREDAPDLMMSAGEETPLGRRQPLSRRLTIAAVSPLVVYTALTLVTLAIVLTSAQRNLISTNAATVAAAVGSVLNTTDQNTVQQQLGTLLGRDSVGFVQVELPDGTIFFRSRTPALDNVLNERINTWIKANPVSGVFVQNQTPAALYNTQLEQLASIGADDSQAAQALKDAIKDPANQQIANRSFQVERVGVYVTADGSRQTLAANAKSNDPLLYRIAVGVPVDGAQAQLRNTLLILLLAGLIAALIGVALAARATRRIVEPIERLVKAANAISLGDLSQTVRPEVNDEMGDLAQALERMRLSLDAAMNRLRKRRKV